MLVPGADKAVRAVQAGKAAVFLLDRGASANTRKQAEDKCLFHKVPIALLEPGCLGEAIGESAVMAAAVLRGSIAGHILTLIQKDEDPER